MTREAALLVIVGVAIVLLALGVWAWRRRVRRDSGLAAPVGEIPDGARHLASIPVLYVATTAHGSALERLAIRGLGFRARGTVIVTDAGVALDLQGQHRLFVPSARVVEVGQATVTIDRVVERDGLTRLVWRIDEDTLVDSYFRPQDASARALAAAIEPILPVPTSPPTGSDS